MVKNVLERDWLFSLKQTHSVTPSSRDCWFTGECHSVILVSFVKSLKNESIVAIMIPWQRQITDTFDVVERVAVLHSLAIGGLGEISIQSLRMLFSLYICHQLFLLSKVPTLRLLKVTGARVVILVARSIYEYGPLMMVGTLQLENSTYSLSHDGKS